MKDQIPSNQSSPIPSIPHPITILHLRSLRVRTGLTIHYLPLGSSRYKCTVRPCTPPGKWFIRDRPVEKSSLTTTRQDWKIQNKKVVSGTRFAARSSLEDFSMLGLVWFGLWFLEVGVGSWGWGEKEGEEVKFPVVEVVACVQLLWIDEDLFTVTMLSS